MNLKERKDEAVSPVIGIMLMLVVTIIIAAVITGFATDLSKDTEKTPVALFEVQYADGIVGFKHKGGDPIPLKDLQLTVEQSGGALNNGIINVFSGEGKHDDYDYAIMTYPLTVRGQEDKKSGAVVTTGDVIQIKSSDLNIGPGGTLIWTLTYTPTNIAIANGENYLS